MNINELLAVYRPTKIKMDIEGAEAEVLPAISDFGEVSAIAFEYHFDLNGDIGTGHRRFGTVREHLRSAGFDVSTMERDMKRNWNLVFTVRR